MLIITTDGSAETLSKQKDIIQDAFPDAEILAFTSAEQAAEFISAESVRPDMLITETELPDCPGIELASRLRAEAPYMHTVFVTANPAHALEAFAMHADGYVLKPLTAEKAEDMAGYYGFRHSPKKGADKLRVRCFGNFEVFYNGEPVLFKRARSKELFAMLVDREGAVCTAGEIADALWYDEIDLDSAKNRIRVLVNDIKTTFERLGFGDILIRRSGVVAVRREYLDCDYYRLLDGDRTAAEDFCGDYMLQYFWAEETSSRLYFKYIDRYADLP